MLRHDLSRVKSRDALRPNDKAEPYWQRIRPGCFLGYCPAARGGEGTWSARAYDPDTLKYRKRTLGVFADQPGNARFALAKQHAEKFAELVESGGLIAAKVLTVADACKAFAADRPYDEARFRRYVYSKPIASVKLDRLRRHHILKWRDDMVQQPALVGRSRNKGANLTRPRSLSTVNRDMAVLRTALGRVLSPGRPGSEAAWQEGLKPYRNATRRRTLYLDLEQRRSLIQGVEAEAVPFVSALCQLPMRPGAVAGLNVSDFDRRTSELSIGKDKTGQFRRIKLPEQASSLMAGQTTDRPPDAPLFARANGTRWVKETWRHPIAAAVALAGLPPATTAYTLRHSTITDLVLAGLPILTIAQISGTSVEMIERHYGHLVSDAALEALGTLAL